MSNSALPGPALANQSMTSANRILGSDKPRLTPDQDSLGYDPFAKHLAEAIMRMSPIEGFIIGLFGEWGVGKSTILNFIKYHLEQSWDANNLMKSEAPVLVEFNPWWFTTRDDLTRAFINQLVDSVALHETQKREIKELAAGLFSVMSTIPYGGAKNLERIAEWISAEPVPKLKDKIVGILKEEKRKIIVTIDDIDRLPIEEIREIFRLVKVVFDLPNIIYVLAFDREIVIRALSTDYGMTGHAFLEKIIQLPFDLPMPDQMDLENMLIEEIAHVMDDKIRVDNERMNAIFFRGIVPLLRTPRDVVRFSNTLAAAYPLVTGEVNFGDFLGIEALRVFQHAVYEIIRNNQSQFAAIPQTQHMILARNFHEEWANELFDGLSLNEQKAIKEILQNLFPIFGWAMSDLGTDMFPTDEQSWISNLRICSSDLFRVYFKLSVPGYSVSQFELDQLIGLAGSADFEKSILRMRDQQGPKEISRLGYVLERLIHMNYSGIAEESICKMITHLLIIGDELIKNKDMTFGSWGLLSMENLQRLEWLILELLKCLKHTDQATCVQTGIKEAKGISTPTAIVRRLETERLAARPDGQVISVEQMGRLKSECLKRIQEQATRGTLLQLPYFSHVLTYWGELTTPEEVRYWLYCVIDSEEEMLPFLREFLPDKAMRLPQSVLMPHYYEGIEHFIDLANYTALFEDLLKQDDITDLDKKRVEFVLRRVRLRDPDHQVF